MNSAQYRDLWKQYFCEAINSNNYEPNNGVLKELFSSYISNNTETKVQADYIPEPYLGNFDTATVAMINLNPGGVLSKQHWTTGEIGKEFRRVNQDGNDNFYDNWAKNNMYLDYMDNIEKKCPDSGNQFMKERIENYFNIVLERNLTKKDILCLELFSWHSYKFGKVRNKGKVFKEYILEPLLDTKVKYVFLLRAPIIEAAEQAGISLKTIEHNWKSSSLNVKIGTYEGIIFIATKNFMKGYPGTQEDKEVIKRKIKELEDNLSRKS